MRAAARHSQEVRRTSCAEARLALVEALLSTDEAGRAVRLGLEWLAEHGGVRQAVCLALSEDGRRLTGAGGLGVQRQAVTRLWIDLEDEEDHLLAHALGAAGPVGFPRAERPIPFLTGPCVGLPLRSRQHPLDSAAGLLVSGQLGALEPELCWLSEVLGEKLAGLRAAQRRAERRSSRERALLRGALAAVAEPVLVTDAEGKLLVANPRAERLLVARERDCEGRREAASINGMLLGAALAGRALSAEPTRSRLLLVDPGDGADLSLEVLARTVRQPDGSKVIVSVLRSVAEPGQEREDVGENARMLRAAQDEARSERHQMDLILKSVVDPILVTGPAGEIVLMNPVAEQLFIAPQGCSELVQRRVRSNGAQFSAFVSSLAFSGSEMKSRGELSLLEPLSGAPLPVEAISGKLLSERGELTTVVTMLHDRREALEKARLYDQLKAASAQLEAKVQVATAELAHQNELLRRQAVALEQASAAKSQFLANMSHEFRTPLNAILGYTHMLLQGVSGELNASQRRSLVRIDSNGRHLLEVINEILDITRIEAGKMPLHLSEFQLPDLLREVLSELEPIISRSHLELITHLSPKLPELRSDRQKVKQIVVNLLSNALKFTHHGRIRIGARYDRRTRTVAIAVQDTGIGIARKDLERVFEDFRQVDNSPTRPYGGTGLGLSICRRLAHMLDGRISVQSEPGKGSTFTLYIPRRTRR